MATSSHQIREHDLDGLGVEDKEDKKYVSDAQIATYIAELNGTIQYSLLGEDGVKLDRQAREAAGVAIHFYFAQADRRGLSVNEFLELAATEVGVEVGVEDTVIVTAIAIALAKAKANTNTNTNVKANTKANALADQGVVAPVDKSVA